MAPPEKKRPTRCATRGPLVFPAKESDHPSKRPCHMTCNNTNPAAAQAFALAGIVGETGPIFYRLEDVRGRRPVTAERMCVVREARALFWLRTRAMRDADEAWDL